MDFSGTMNPYELMGRYLVMCNSLDSLMHACLQIFVHDQEMMDSLQKESFDFKCRKLKHYLTLFERSGLLDPGTGKFLLPQIDYLEKSFKGIRRLRNFLAHAIFVDPIFQSSRRYKGESNGVKTLDQRELQRELNSLQSILSDAEITFKGIAHYLKNLPL